MFGIAATPVSTTASYLILAADAIFNHFENKKIILNMGISVAI
jgi:hypothetical protein